MATSDKYSGDFKPLLVLAQATNKYRYKNIYIYGKKLRKKCGFRFTLNQMLHSFLILKLELTNNKKVSTTEFIVHRIWLTSTRLLQKKFPIPAQLNYYYKW